MEDLSSGEREGFRPTRVGAVHRVGHKGAGERITEILTTAGGVIVMIVVIGMFINITGRNDGVRTATTECIEKTANAQGFHGTESDKYALFAPGCTQ